VPVAKRERFENKGLLCVWWTTKVLFFMNCARRQYDQRGGIFSTIREYTYVYGFARKVTRASKPKARVTSAR
jgi:hypothetical protein